MRTEVVSRRATASFRPLSGSYLLRPGLFFFCWVQGTLGGSAGVQVEVFGCNLAMSLDSSKVSRFAEGRDGRLAKLGAASNLGRKVG